MSVNDLLNMIPEDTLFAISDPEGDDIFNLVGPENFNRDNPNHKMIICGDIIDSTVLTVPTTSLYNAAGFTIAQKIALYNRYVYNQQFI